MSMLGMSEPPESFSEAKTTRFECSPRTSDRFDYSDSGTFICLKSPLGCNQALNKPSVPSELRFLPKKSKINNFDFCQKVGK